ncbi:hypothetical protein RF11_15311 [Thelohanellus kitauei]|uniref:Retrotransposon gag domain-containing protein n=1 Tax=Thelohanellus kitauei TaxID=669202 RepID=A0A0C2IZT2_THEKT|nr:hypothetical protein RF11_15311 [Thelohanellus kitauei]
MSARYTKRINVFLQRYQFGERNRREESIIDFVTALKDLAVNCDFGNLTEERVRDQFVLKLKEPHIQQEITRKFFSNKASLQEVVDEAILVSSSTKTATKMQKREDRISEESPDEICKVEYKNKDKSSSAEPTKTLCEVR